MLITDLDHLEIASDTSWVLGSRNSRIPLLSLALDNQELSISYGGAEVYQGTTSDPPLSIQLTSDDDGTVQVYTSPQASDGNNGTTPSSGGTPQSNTGFMFGFSVWTTG
jgi:hypothetical protein